MLVKCKYTLARSRLDVAFTGSPPIDSKSAGFALAAVDLDFSDSTTGALVLAAAYLQRHAL